MIALVLLRGAVDARPAASVCESALVMIALFAAEGSGARRGPPWRDAAWGRCSRRTPGGRGLHGMRERVELYGGRLETGPEAGGWRVRAELPLDGSAVAAA